MRLILTTVLALVTLMAQGKKINEENIRSFCRDANQAVQTATTDDARQTAFTTQASQWFSAKDLEQISAKQVDELFEAGGLTLDRYMRLWLEPTLTAKAAKEPAFAFLTWKYMPENDGFMHSDKETQALIRFLSAPTLQSVIEQNPTYPLDVLNALTTMKDANWHTQGFPEAVTAMMQTRLPEASVLECVKAFNSIARVDTIAADHRNAIRQACIAQYDRLEKSLDNARKKKTCQENIKYLRGPFACGTLVGGEAPEVHFLRVFKQQGDSVAQMPIHTLADLKGKVVLMDFWGTKCVPCVQSFPEVAEIQKHFEGKDVVILGITSLQGYFVDTPNHRTVQCRNNPEKELGCFPAYMKAMGMNWHVAVSEEDVMNTDFGVLAIPHVTLIGRDGRVVHNAVNADKEEKIKLIEQLLEN